MNHKEALEEVEILGALTACSNKKGNRCSQCPVFGRGWNSQCRQIVDKAAVKLIENQKKEIEELKARTRENIKGKWQTVSIGGDTNEIRCTICKQITSVPADRTRKLNFCPECGADMREVRE